MLTLQPESKRSKNTFHCQAGNPPCPYKGEEVNIYLLNYLFKILCKCYKIICQFRVSSTHSTAVALTGSVAWGAIMTCASIASPGGWRARQRGCSSSSSSSSSSNNNNNNSSNQYQILAIRPHLLMTKWCPLRRARRTFLHNVNSNNYSA